MHPNLLAPMLLLLLAGCARSGDTPPAQAPAAAPAIAPPAAPAPARPTVPAQAAAGDDAHAAPGGTAWHAFGNEPFWSVQARGTTLVFSTPEDQAGTTLRGNRVPSLIGTVILGSGPRGKFHFGVTPGKCSDGMSDRTYAHTATFIYDGTTYQGCAEPAGAEQ